MVSNYPTEKAAADAIKAAVEAGRATSGYSMQRWQGARPYYTAHVRKGAAGWCL